MGLVADHEPDRSEGNGSKRFRDARVEPDAFGSFAPRPA
jgi:hypothetical protein